MRHWLLALEFVWLNHRTDFIGLSICTATALGVCGAVLLIGGPVLALRAADATPSEATVIGFVGGDSKLATGLSAYIRARDGNYGLVYLPFNSGCRNGDQIPVNEWQVNGRVVFRARPPGCVHVRGGV